MDVFAELGRLWAAIQADPSFAMIATAVSFALADFLTGVGAAIRAGTFRTELVGSWISGHLLGRVLPIAGIALLGNLNPALQAIAALALATYVAETAVSIKRNLDVAEPAQPQALRGA